MNTKTYRKYKVAKEGTYVFTRYGLEIPLSLNDEYAIVGYTRHKNEIGPKTNTKIKAL